MRIALVLLSSAALTLAGCDKAPDSEANGTGDAAEAQAAPEAPLHQHTDWIGKWTGVEGTFVEITPKEAGHYALEMQYDLDNKGTFEGHDADGGIAFTRGDKEMLLHKASGDETGLKWLAGKKDCLMVEEGEGYCRD